MSCLEANQQPGVASQSDSGDSSFSSTVTNTCRQACSGSTPAGSLNATHYELPRGKPTTGRGFAKRLGRQQLLASCHEHDLIMVEHLFLPLMFPLQSHHLPPMPCSLSALTSILALEPATKWLHQPSWSNCFLPVSISYPVSRNITASFAPSTPSHKAIKLSMNISIQTPLQTTRSAIQKPSFFVLKLSDSARPGSMSQSKDQKRHLHIFTAGSAGIAGHTLNWTSQDSYICAAGLNILGELPIDRSWLTYDIVEAGLVLGKSGARSVQHSNCAPRCLTEELIPSSASKSAGDGIGPPPKRRRRNQYDETKDFPVEIIDLSTESEGEDRVTHRHDPSNHLISEKKGQELQNFVTVLKLEWMNTSIKSGKCVSQDPFVVYLGRKIPPPPPPTKAENKQDLLQKSNQIIQRVNHDASLPTPRAPPPDHIYARRSKRTPRWISQRPRPSYIDKRPQNMKRGNGCTPTAGLGPRPSRICLPTLSTLHSPNEDFISQLVKIRQIRKLTLDEIGVRAYSTSIASLAAYPHPIQRPSEILALPGCNAKIAELFSQFQQHGGCNHTDDDGNVATADALETDPALCVLNSFYQIWGVGAKTAREFYQRGWRDLDDIVEHGWSTLSRVQQIGVKFYEEFQQGVPRAESEGIATVIRDHAGRVRPEAGGGCGIECVIVGGYRRGKGLSGDVDVVLSHRDDAVTRNLVVDVVASLEAERCITHTLSLHLTSSLREQQTLPFDGDDTRKFDTLDKALVVWQDPHFDPTIPGHDGHQGGNPNIHRRVDIIISPWRTIGCAVLGWSGDLTFQRDLRRYAKKARSLKFDSSGVRDRSTGRQIDLEHDGETWEEREKLVMEGLGVGWRPPEERCSR
ncbi:hypothetical protein PDIDSM_9061 [Penicillium digitatum]|nr:hypothetical protein PDIDSM_9061 [Penicillium digitatum]